MPPVPGPDETLRTDDAVHELYRTYDRIRSDSPVFWSDTRRAWVVMRYADCRTILTDPARFSNMSRFDAWLDEVPDDMRTRLQPMYDHTNNGLNFSDPPEHADLRTVFKPITSAFSVRAVAERRPVIQATADELLDRIPSGALDLIADFAYPFPMTVISDIIGFPREDRDQLKSWSEDLLVFLGSGDISHDDVLRSEKAMRGLSDWLDGLIDDRRRHPRGDLLSTLASLPVEQAAQQNVDGTGRALLFSQTVSLVVAGHITTTNLIGNGMNALLHHPSHMRRLRDDPTLVEAAVEEFLRFDAPAQWVLRRVAEDTELGGARMSQDDLVHVMVGAANHDIEVFDDPAALDFERGRNPHLTFGGGIHLCIGRALGRLEAQIAITTLLRRLGNLRHDPTRPPRRRPQNVHRGLESLPVLFDP